MLLQVRLTGFGRKAVTVTLDLYSSPFSLPLRDDTTSDLSTLNIIHLKKTMLSSQTETTSATYPHAHAVPYLS